MAHASLAMVSAHASAGRGFDFISAVFARDALAWLWSYTVELHPRLFPRSAWFAPVQRAARAPAQTTSRGVRSAPAQAPGLAALAHRPGATALGGVGAGVWRAASDAATAHVGALDVPMVGLAPAPDTPPMRNASGSECTPRLLHGAVTQLCQAPPAQVQMAAEHVLSLLDMCGAHLDEGPVLAAAEQVVRRLDEAIPPWNTEHASVREDAGRRVLAQLARMDDGRVGTGKAAILPLHATRVRALRIQAQALAGRAWDALPALGELLGAHEHLVRAQGALHPDAGTPRAARPAAELPPLYAALHATLEALVALESGSAARRACDWLFATPLSLVFLHPTFPRVTRAVYTLAARVPNAVAYAYELHAGQAQPSAVAGAVGVMALALANRGAPEAAARIVLSALDAGVELREAVVRRVLRLLGHVRHVELGDMLVQRLEREYAGRGGALEAATLRALALRAAQQGDVAGVEARLAALRTAYGAQAHGATLALHAPLIAAAERGDVPRLTALFEAHYHFPLREALAGREAPGTPAELLAFYTMHAFVQRDDPLHARAVLEQYVAGGQRVSERLYSELIRMHALLGNAEGALAAAAQRDAAGLRCSPRSLRHLVGAMARCRDPEGASRLVAHYARRGTRLDLRVYTALLDAYVEAGRWNAASGIFSWLAAHADAALQPDTQVYNTMLKAHVVRPASVQTVLRFFFEMRSAGAAPDARTYALLLQSACDARRMALAEELFAMADKALAGTASGGASLYHYTIMIHGYLRVGARERARAYFERMRRRGIEPSHVTFGVLINSYAQGGEATLRLAQDLALRLADEALQPVEQRAAWRVPALAQGAPFEDLLSPLVSAHAKRGEVDEADQVFQRLLDTGARPSLRALTALLNAYRYAGEAGAVFRLWDHVFRVALDTCRSTAPAASGADAPVAFDQRNLLCLPLSIVIDFASRSGLHDRVAQEWNRVKRAGFAFDPHNWNHLCAALARADRLGDALQVIEHVLPHVPPAWERGMPVRAPHAAPAAHAEKDAYAQDPLLQLHTRDSLDAAHAQRTPPPARPPNRREQDRGAELGLDGRALLDTVEARAPPDAPGARAFFRTLQQPTERHQWFATFDTLCEVQAALARARHATHHDTESTGERRQDPVELMRHFPRASARLSAFTRQRDRHERM